MAVRFGVLGLLVFALASAGHTQRVRIVADDLGDELSAQLVAVLPEESAAETPLEARRQARRAAEILRAELNTRGYHDPEIDFAVEPGPPPVPMVRVAAGRLFTISDIEVEWTGAPPLAQDEREAREALAVRPGDPAEAAPVLRGQQSMADRLNALGYPDAQPGEPQIIGNREMGTISVRYRIEAGPKVRYGDVIFEGQVRTRERYLRALVPKPMSGEIHDPETLGELNGRLSETRLFRLASARLVERVGAVGADGIETRDVVVTLTERPRHTVTAGGRYSTSEGFGATASWTRRNFTGRGDTLALEASVAELERALDAQWSRPNQFGYGRNFVLSAGIADQTTDAYDRRAVTVGAAVDVRRDPRFVWSVYTSLEATNETDVFGERNVQILRVGGAARIDRSDDPLNATEGWKLDLSVTPTVTTGDLSAQYVRAIAQLSAYLPVGEERRLVLAGRLKAGAVAGAEGFDLPVGDRFYAGGGGSVRGYEYQSIGPRDLARNVPFGGSSLLEGSVEARYRLRDKISVVAFVDGGAVGTGSVPEADGLRYGAGFGVRYDTAAGPIRFDIATPLDARPSDDPVQIYISIGQAF